MNATGKVDEVVSSISLQGLLPLSSWSVVWARVRTAKLQTVIRAALSCCGPWWKTRAGAPFV